MHELNYAAVVVAAPLEAAARTARTNHEARHRNDLRLSRRATGPSWWAHLLSAPLRLTARAGPALLASVDGVPASVEAAEVDKAA